MNMLFHDRRAELQGRAGAHALIVGVSSYPRVSGKLATEFGQLSSSAISAYSVAKWFTEDFAHPRLSPSTCRLLIAPSSKELAADSALKELSAPCNVDAFTVAASAWREDAASHKENLALFYFAGHGLELESEQAVLFDDFGSGIGPTLRSAVGVKNIMYGMAPSRHPDIARTQLFFIDCGRTKTKLFKQFEYQNSTAVFDVDLSVFDDRCAPVFYASTSGGKAFDAKSGRTLFCEALLRCLRGEGASSRLVDDGGNALAPHVSVFSLIHALKQALRALAAHANRTQEFTVSGLVRDSLINQLGSLPRFEVTLRLEPESAIPVAQVRVFDANGTLVAALPTPLQPHPYTIKLPPGLFSVTARIEPPQDRLSDRSIVLQVPAGEMSHVIRLAKK